MSREDYESGKEVAVATFVDALLPKIREEMLRSRQMQSVPFVTHALYYDEGPEGHFLESLRQELDDSVHRLCKRLDLIKACADEAMGSPDNFPIPHEIWDRVRLQRAGIQQEALRAIVWLVALAFTADQYTTTRYLWRDDRHFGEPVER